MAASAHANRVFSREEVPPVSDHASKAEVQSTPLNKLPVPGQDEAEFSAEEAAEAFENAESAQSSPQQD